MPDVAFAPGPRVAGKRIPIPTVKHERTPATAAKAARKTAARAAAGAPDLAASAARAAGTAARSARTGAKTAARSAKTGAETGAAAVQFAQNVMPRQHDARSKAVHRAPAVGAAIAAGVGLEYLLDPADGRRRRRVMRDKTLAATRRFAHRGAQSARYASGKAHGAVHTATSAASPPADDHALADRVRTEIFRRPDAPKGNVVVGAVEGVVTLRGEVSDPEEMRRLADEARAVPGVRGVENLLHTPDMPAPTGGTA